MFPYSFPAPANFTFPGSYAPAGDASFRAGPGSISVIPHEGGFFRLSAALGRDNDEQYSAAELLVAGQAAPATSRFGDWHIWEQGDWCLEVNPADGMSFVFRHRGVGLVSSAPAPFGYSARRQMVLLRRDPQAPILGLGEKTGRLDKNNRSWHFWNANVISDHRFNYQTDAYDPTYVSIPLMISRSGDRWFGILLHNPTPSSIQLNLDTRNATDKFSACHGMRPEDKEPISVLTVEQGRLDLVFIPGPTLRDVVRNVARLTGTHELPPLWALGYHQCRWGYSSAGEIATVARRLADARIPCGAMWMDIDYMDGFRVFTYDPERFPKEERDRCFAEIRRRGTRLVSIIDPGIKAEEEWEVYRDARDRGLLCQTPEGKVYTGQVWPGRTVFPDYSLPEARSWWADRIAAHLATGIDGIWNDMNDPSTGVSEQSEMWFHHSTLSHGTYHNQYGDLMARATLEGFEKADPNRRPFILTRSASTGSQRFCAVWTGDNVSNEAHLRMSIPMCLNLSLCGVSFTGPDVGGFMHDTTEELLVAWNLAGALFPFFRNHTCSGTRPQEPYNFSADALDTIRRAINVRYKLLPAIYQLFRDHALHGDPVMRPLFLEFPEEYLEGVDSQFLLGPSILVAPFLDVDSRERTVVLPSGWWYSLREATWVKGPDLVTVPRDNRMNIYIRDGAIIPMVEGADFFPQPDLSNVAFHFFFREAAEATFVYHEDDGETRAHRDGAFNEWRVDAKAAGGRVEASVRLVHNGWTPRKTPFKAWFHGLDGVGAREGLAPWPFGALPGSWSELAP